MPSKDFLVCGTLNLETTLPVSDFPLAYQAVRSRRFELQPSGVASNVARALTVLGNRVRLSSLIVVDFWVERCGVRLRAMALGGMGGAPA